TVTIRQQNGQGRTVYREAVEVHRSEREDGLDAVRRALSTIENEMSDDSFTPTRMPHRPDPGQIELADEPCTERSAAGGVATVQNVQVFLDQLSTRQRTEIADLVVSGIDPVRAYRDDDISMTGQDLGKVIVSFVARDRLA